MSEVPLYMRAEGGGSRGTMVHTSLLSNPTFGLPLLIIALQLRTRTRKQALNASRCETLGQLGQDEPASG